MIHMPEFPEDVKKEAVLLYNSGISTAEIAKQLNTTSGSVARWLRERNCKFRSRTTPDDIIDLVVSEYLNGYGYYTIARKLNISESSVKRGLIRRGITLRTESEYKKLSAEHAPRGEHNWNWSGGRGVFPCGWCGADVERPVNEIKRKKYGHVFCSTKCMGEFWTTHLNGKNNHHYINGATYGDYCEKFNRFFRKRVRAFLGNTCMLCGKSAEENNRNMSVHHLYKNKDACCDDNISKSKFAVLCISCHNKADKNDELNKQLIDIINTKYGGKCYYTREEWKEYRLAETNKK